MKRLAFAFVSLLAPAYLAGQVPDFSGSFAAEGQFGTVVVTLEVTGNGQYSGTLSNGNLTWKLQGEVYEDALTGTVDTGQGMMAFEAHVSNSELQLILVEIGPDGTPLVDQGQELLFTRTPDQARGEPASSPAFPGFSGAVAGSDPFIGRFSNGQLTLALQGSGGSYTGQLSMGAEAYPVSAQRSGDRLAGAMNAPTGQYEFILSASADGIVLSSAGTEYALRRVADRQGSPGPGAMQQPGQAQTDNSPLAQQWRAHLAGKKVTYISSYSSNTLGGGGLNTKFVYHLCSNGEFAFSGSDVVSHNIVGSGVEGGGSAGSTTGTWRIITQGQLAGIELRYGNGNVEQYRLDMQGGQTFANGDRVYVTPGEVCR